MATALHRKPMDEGAVAHAMSLLGNRWTFMILRELMFGGRRFSHLMSGIPGISSNVLSSRLQQLEVAGLVARRELAQPVAQQLYELTQIGCATGPVLRALSKWGSDEPAFNATGHTTAASILLTMQVSFNTERSTMPECTLGLSLGQEAFVILVRKSGLTVSRVERLDDVAAVIITDCASLLRALAGSKSATDLAREGILTIGGDTDLFNHLFAQLQQARSKAAMAMELVGT